jgi:hypothetical protein
MSEPGRCTLGRHDWRKAGFGEPGLSLRFECARCPVTAWEGSRRFSRLLWRWMKREGRSLSRPAA